MPKTSWQRILCRQNSLFWIGIALAQTCCVFAQHRSFLRSSYTITHGRHYAAAELFSLLSAFRTPLPYSNYFGLRKHLASWLRCCLQICQLLPERSVCGRRGRVSRAVIKLMDLLLLPLRQADWMDARNWRRFAEWIGDGESNRNRNRTFDWIKMKYLEQA